MTVGTPPSSHPASADPDPDLPVSAIVRRGLDSFYGWPLRRKVFVAAATSFVLFHIGAVLLRGAPKKIREPLWPLAAWYSEGLRMTDTWGMFSLPPKDKLVSIVGITDRGARVELSHVLQNERDWKQRIVDTRLRKIQTKLASEKTRNHWGRGYVDYYCKKGLAQGLPLRRVQVEVQAKLAEKPEVFLSQSCRDMSSFKRSKR